MSPKADQFVTEIVMRSRRGKEAFAVQLHLDITREDLDAFFLKRKITDTL